MKHILTIIALSLTSTAFFAQNSNQTNPPPVQQVVNFNPVNNVENENNDNNVDRNINIQIQQINNDQEEQQGNSFSNNVKQEKEKDPCPDCDKIKKAKRENYGNNYAGNYNGGANKFKRKRNWKRFCYNISHRSGGKRIKTNYSMCFNW